VASKTNPDTHPLSDAETHPGIIQALLDLAWGNRWCANKWFERSLRGRRSPGLPKNSLPESVQQAMRQRSSEFVRRISQSATMPGESLARLPPRASTCATFCKASVPIAGRPHLGIFPAICVEPRRSPRCFVWDFLASSRRPTLTASGSGFREHAKTSPTLIASRTIRLISASTLLREHPLVDFQHL